MGSCQPNLQRCKENYRLDIGKWLQNVFYTFEIINDPRHRACAIIENESKILVARRAEDQKLAGKWEFPGGKVEAGESPEGTWKENLKKS